MEDARIARERPRQRMRERREHEGEGERRSTTDHPIMRTAASYAPSASPAPSIRPTITWPAIARASRTSARKMKSWYAI